MRDTRYHQASSTETVPHENSPSLLKNENRDMNNFICASEGAQFQDGIIPLTFKLDRCEDDYVKGLVMAREEGSGYLGRLWLTRGLTPGGEILRIYIDDEREPVVEVGVDAMLDGSAGEMFAAPFGAESESHVAWYYPVVFSDRLIMTVDALSPGEIFYFQTDVVLDATQRSRRRVCDRLPERDAAIAVLSSTTDGPAPASIDWAQETEIALDPGETERVADIEGPGTVETFLVRIAKNDVRALDGVWLTVHWDGASKAALDLPLAELLAVALDAPTHGALALGATFDGTGELALRLSLPMPFSNRASWTVENRGASTAEFAIELLGSRGVPTESWGRLHAQRHETLAPAEGLHPILHESGCGRFVGTCLFLEGHGDEDFGAFAAPLNFLEGDEVGAIDGRAIKGTGTEDYLNGSFYFQEGAFGTAFAQGWGVSSDAESSPPRGHVSACRWHVLGDAVHFAEKIDLDLEIGPGRPDLLDRYRTVAFYYQ